MTTTGMDRIAGRLSSTSAPSRPLHVWLPAILIAITCATISFHVAFFHSVPYALAMLACTIYATLYGTSVSVAIVATNLIVRVIFRLLYHSAPPLLSRYDLLATTVLFTAAIAVSLLTRNRRRAAYQLELAHVELQERTDALIQSLHSSKCATWTMDVATEAGPIWYLGSFQIFGAHFVENAGLKGFLSLLHPEDSHRIATLIQQLKQTDAPILWEFRAAWPNGDTHWFEMRATRVPKTASLWRGLTVDITDRKQAEFALLRSEKLAAMGRLASTVAHEINNPLESVTNLLYLARTDPHLTPDTQTYLATAETELARLAEITRLTLGFVRSNSTSRAVDVGVIADEVLSIFRHRLENKGVHVIRTYQTDVSIQIAPHELRQILTNLISNAADAIISGESRLGIEVQACSNTKVRIRIEDSGTGMTPEILSRVFEPFFTTKFDIGTGIGLWVTKELVESNGGRIFAESGSLAPQVTTRFTVEFPAATA